MVSVGDLSELNGLVGGGEAFSAEPHPVSPPVSPPVSMLKRLRAGVFCGVFCGVLCGDFAASWSVVAVGASRLRPVGTRRMKLGRE